MRTIASRRAHAVLAWHDKPIAGDPEAYARILRRLTDPSERVRPCCLRLSCATPDDG